MMSPENLEKTNKALALGRSRFVLFYGVLGWGIPTAILFVLLRSYQEGWDSFLFQLIPALVLFPLGGIVVGRVLWNRLMKKSNSAASTGATR
jgi:hypothetical protein